MRFTGTWFLLTLSILDFFDCKQNIDKGRYKAYLSLKMSNYKKKSR